MSGTSDKLQSYTVLETQDASVVKVNSYAVLAPVFNGTSDKLQSYSVLETQDSSVAKVNSYAVLAPVTAGSSDKLQSYTVLETQDSSVVKVNSYAVLEFIPGTAETFKQNSYVLLRDRLCAEAKHTSYILIEPVFAIRETKNNTYTFVEEPLGAETFKQITYFLTDDPYGYVLKSQVHAPIIREQDSAQIVKSLTQAAVSLPREAQVVKSSTFAVLRDPNQDFIWLRSNKTYVLLGEDLTPLIAKSPKQSVAVLTERGPGGIAVKQTAYILIEDLPSGTLYKNTSYCLLTFPDETPKFRKSVTYVLGAFDGSVKGFKASGYILAEDIDPAATRKQTTYVLSLPPGDVQVFKDTGYVLATDDQARSRKNSVYALIAGAADRTYKQNFYVLGNLDNSIEVKKQSTYALVDSPVGYTSAKTSTGRVYSLIEPRPNAFSHKNTVSCLINLDTGVRTGKTVSYALLTNDPIINPAIRKQITYVLTDGPPCTLRTQAVYSFLEPDFPEKAYRYSGQSYILIEAVIKSNTKRTFNT